jgi:hypothetical protein
VIVIAIETTTGIEATTKGQIRAASSRARPMTAAGIIVQQMCKVEFNW